MQTSVKERLITFLAHLGLGQKAFAEKVGVSSGFVNSIRVSIQPKTLDKIAFAYPELNITWLLTGEGEMLRDAPSAVVVAEEAQPMVPLIPVASRAGKFDDYVASVRDGSCELVPSPVKGADIAVPIYGDSMEPEYPNGAVVFVKRINESAFIEWGKVFVLDTCNGAIIKRLYPGDTDDVLQCRSINSDYPPFCVSMKDIYGIYRVLSCHILK